MLHAKKFACQLLIPAAVEVDGVELISILRETRKEECPLASELIAGM